MGGLRVGAMLGSHPWNIGDFLTNLRRQYRRRCLNLHAGWSEDSIFWLIAPFGARVPIIRHAVVISCNGGREINLDAHDIVEEPNWFAVLNSTPFAVPKPSLSR